MGNSSRDGNTRPPYLFLRNLYAGQEATVRTGYGTTDWFQIGKGLCQGCMVKNRAANVGDMGLILGLRRHTGEGNGTLSSILAWEIS